MNRNPRKLVYFGLPPQQPNHPQNHQPRTHQFLFQLLLFEQPRTEASSEQHRYFAPRRDVADRRGLHGVEHENVGERGHRADAESVLDRKSVV